MPAGTQPLGSYALYNFEEEGESMSIVAAAGSALANLLQFEAANYIQDEQMRARTNGTQQEDSYYQRLVARQQKEKAQQFPRWAIFAALAAVGLLVVYFVS